MSTTYATAGAGRHRGPASNPVLPRPPDDREKYLCIQRNLFFLATTMVIGASTVIIGQVEFGSDNPLAWPFVVFTVTFLAYQVIPDAGPGLVRQGAARRHLSSRLAD